MNATALKPSNRALEHVHLEPALRARRDATGVITLRGLTTDEIVLTEETAQALRAQLDVALHSPPPEPQEPDRAHFYPMG